MSNLLIGVKLELFHLFLVFDEDFLLQQMLNLMTELQRSQLRPPTPSGTDKRAESGGKNSRKGKAEKAETAEEPVLVQEFALLTGLLSCKFLKLSYCPNDFQNKSLQMISL